MVLYLSNFNGTVLSLSQMFYTVFNLTAVQPSALVFNLLIDLRLLVSCFSDFCNDGFFFCTIFVRSV